MMRLRKILPLLVLLAVAVGGGTWIAGQQQPGKPQPNNVLVVTSDPTDQAELPAGESVEVLRVVDGDTLKVRTTTGTERVRIIGIDTPEIGRNGKTDDCYAREATTMLEQLIAGRPVELRADPSQDDTDRYGRLLRHVFASGGSVGQALIAAGAAHEYTYDRAYAGQTAYRAAERSAREQTIGLWGECKN